MIAIALFRLPFFRGGVLEQNLARTSASVGEALVAGAVFTTGKTINIPYAYADLRFNPAFDAGDSATTRSTRAPPSSVEVSSRRERPSTARYGTAGSPRATRQRWTCI